MPAARQQPWVPAPPAVACAAMLRTAGQPLRAGKAAVKGERRKSGLCQKALFAL